MYARGVKRGGPVPEAALPATDWPACVVIGPSRIATQINNRAVARRAASRTLKLVRVGPESALALPGGQPTWWIERSWGGYLVRADVEGTESDRRSGWNKVASAIAAVSRWRTVDDWKVADPTAFLLILSGPGTGWAHTSPPIPPATYLVEVGSSTIAAIDFQVIRFTRAGEVAVDEHAAPRAEVVPSVPKPIATIARALRWVSSHGGPLLVLDRELSRGWGGTYDATGREVFAEGGDCDYNHACSGSEPTLKIGRGSAMFLETAAPTTWLAERNVILRSISCDDEVTTVAGAFEIPEPAWKRTRAKLTIGKTGARIMDATARGAKPHITRQSHGCHEVLDFALPAGTYTIERCEREGVYLLAGKRSTYALEAYRLVRR